ncbi:MAG: undecaprenyl phosphate translocase family protein, partial [Planctomycetota bacterium]
MGICDLIPGISGGTIAFITGIYERLINAVKAFSPGLFLSF